MARSRALGIAGVDDAWSTPGALEDCQISTIAETPSTWTGVLRISGTDSSAGKKLAAASSDRRRSNGPLDRTTTDGRRLPACVVGLVALVVVAIFRSRPRRHPEAHRHTPRPVLCQGMQQLHRQCRKVYSDNAARGRVAGHTTVRADPLSLAAVSRHGASIGSMAHRVCDGLRFADQLRGIAPLIIVPAEDLDQVAGDDLGERQVDDGSV